MPILLKNQFNNSREDILEVEAPEPLTPKHVTVPHSFFVEEAEKNFEAKGLSVKEEKYFLSRDKNDNEAFSVVRVDSFVGDEVISELKKLTEIISVQQLHC